MKRIIESKKLFNLTQDTDLASLKTIYRNLIKEWHPDKFQDEAQKAEAELKSQSIIDAYQLLVSISPETHAANSEEYTDIITNSGISNYNYKGQTLKVTFQNGSEYEYFGVPKSVYNNMNTSTAISRFARRHIFNSYTFRNITKSTVAV